MVENENLIKAFDENFNELFYLLATELKITIEEIKASGKEVTKEILVNKHKINVDLIYNILIILSFRKSVSKYISRK